MQRKSWLTIALGTAFLGLASMAAVLRAADQDPFDQSAVPIEVQPTDTKLNKIVRISLDNSRAVPSPRSTFLSLARRPEVFGPAPPGSLLTLDKGSFSVTVGTGETLPKAGLFLGTSDASGIIHEHIGSTISNSFGDPLPGFYRFSMALLTDTAGITKSGAASFN